MRCGLSEVYLSCCLAVSNEELIFHLPRWMLHCEDVMTHDFCGKTMYQMRSKEAFITVAAEQKLFDIESSCLVSGWADNR